MELCPRQAAHQALGVWVWCLLIRPANMRVTRLNAELGQRQRKGAVLSRSTRRRRGAAAAGPSSMSGGGSAGAILEQRMTCLNPKRDSRGTSRRSAGLRGSPAAARLRGCTMSPALVFAKYPLISIKKFIYTLKVFKIPSNSDRG
jgi:hypothetical protein